MPDLPMLSNVNQPDLAKFRLATLLKIGMNCISVSFKVMGTQQTPSLLFCME